MDGIRLINDIAVEGKRVFVRVDFNVPLDEHGNVSDDTRIVSALTTIKYLLNEGAKVILASHLGRPKGRKDPKFTLRPVAKRLATLLNQPIIFLQDCIGGDVEKTVMEMSENSVVLLENLRFYKEEEANDLGFAKKLAKLAEIYVNDAFGTVHRAHASTTGMVDFVAIKAAGFLVEKELDFLIDKINNPQHPFCVVLGGAKVSDKIEVIKSLITKADKILIGGGMSYTFALAKGNKVGDSLVEPACIEFAKELLNDAKKNNVELYLPIDDVATDNLDFNARKVGNLKTFENGIENGWKGVDIGQKTIKKYTEIITSSKIVLWNGPLGVFEIKDCANGSKAIAEAMANCNGTTIIGGGDCLKAVKQSGCSDKISFLSTGGGASLQLLEGKPLPGLEALKK